MPEGDSLRRIALALRPLVGRRVAASSPNPRGRATGVAEVVDGLVLEDVRAVGKNLLLRFEGDVTVRSHLRMNGRWRVLPAGAQITGSPWLVLRTPVGIAVQSHGPVLVLERSGAALRATGPDLLDDDVDVAALVGRVRATDPTRPLAEALQDQRLLAGIGNMWASEGLWSVGLHPRLPVARATDPELTRLLVDLRAAMRAAITGRRPAHAVYRRSGRPCPRCATPIASLGVGDANRRAYLCPTCQPAP
jgi:endonuclease-8